MTSSRRKWVVAVSHFRLQKYVAFLVCCAILTTLAKTIKADLQTESMAIIRNLDFEEENNRDSTTSYADSHDLISSAQSDSSNQSGPPTLPSTLPYLIDDQDTSSISSTTTTNTTTIDGEHHNPTITPTHDTRDPETTTPEAGSTTTTSSTTNSTTTKAPVECPDQGYCLNGGTCVLDERDNMICICPEGFYGARCQTRNICKTLIINNLTGDQICSHIGRDCWKSDKFFRCNCLEDEYFIFKASEQPEATTPAQNERQVPLIGIRDTRSLNERIKDHRDSGSGRLQKSVSDLGRWPRISASVGMREKTDGGEKSNDKEANNSNNNNNNNNNRELQYVAECRKMDKCIGVRCRQLSERCKGGQCVCNEELGYMRDPRDNLCKLLDPCELPTKDGKPICGQAQCVATYDKEHYKCICPIGYQALRVGEHRNSTVCTVFRNLICSVPLLNKCQHICNVDSLNNNYKCSCLRGYKPGTRPGIDDNMCFFIEQVDELDELLSSSSSAYSSGAPPNDQFVYRPYPAPMKRPPPGSSSTTTPSSPAHSPRSTRDTFTYEPLLPLPSPTTTSTSSTHESIYNPVDEEDQLGSSVRSEFIIKRETRSTSGLGPSGRIRHPIPGSSQNQSMAQAGDQRNHEGEIPFNRMSAQERCNMYCDENKICELEQGSTDSYRCVCDRQGFVSVGDRCLDWCSAAEFDSQRRTLLEYTCWSGICKANRFGTRPSPSSSSSSRARALNNNRGELNDAELAKLEAESSWKPDFECDCSNSPLLIQDPITKLCKFDFMAAINPCLPGNAGYTECVEHKNAYCAVLYKPHKQFISDHQRDRIYKASLAAAAAAANLESAANSTIGKKSILSGNQNSNANKCKKPVTNKLYTCVCSPEKKFLVDKPRNKERCVDECDLLNVECGRFNRMCRSSTMEIKDFGHRNLIHAGPDGLRIDFRRTGCECLPGFNVGPSESLDVTVDDNNPKQPGETTIIPGDIIGDSTYSIINFDDPIPITYIKDGNSVDPDSSQFRTKYMNINSRCLLDYDVVEFHASFKAPSDFNPNWINIKNAARSLPNNNLDKPSKQPEQNNSFRRANTVKSIENLDRVSHNQQNLNNIQEKQFEPLNQNHFTLDIPDYMHVDIADLNKHIVLVGFCDPSLMPISVEAFSECIKYRYWIVQKLRHHYVDWRRVIREHLRQTFDLMEGNIRLRVNKCEATLKSVERPETGSGGADDARESAPSPQPPSTTTNPLSSSAKRSTRESVINEVLIKLDPHDQQVVVDANIHCELTLHSASEDSLPRYARKVLLEKQLQRFIFSKSNNNLIGKDYYLMAPNMLIERDSFDYLAKHRKEFNPCKSNYPYCEKQTRCDMVDTVNFTCTCEYGYTPIGSRDIYYADSRKEVCEDINECLFDVCKELANVSTCINEIGDYRCQCNRHYIGDNKRYCKHVCSTISCKHGKCRLVDDHHAFCECDEGYKETDCSVQDPNVALRKANMIICGSIFTSVLLLAITFAISLNSQLKKTKRKLKQIEAANDSGRLFEFANNQPFRQRLSKVSMTNA